MTATLPPTAEAPTRRTVAVLGRFADADSLRQGAERLARDGYTRFDAHSPFPVEGLEGLVRVPVWPILLAAALFGIGGVAVALGIQVYANLDYPLNVGGRALLAWTAFSLPALQFGTLGAVAGAFLAFLWLCGLPRLAHPVFGDPRFADASGDGFFLSIDTDDPRFAPDRAADALRRAGAVWVRELPE